MYSHADSNTTNIQEKRLTVEKQVALLTAALRSPTLYGAVLRVLIRRVKYSQAPHSSHDLQILLLVALAENRLKAEQHQETTSWKKAYEQDPEAVATLIETMLEQAKKGRTP